MQSKLEKFSKVCSKIAYYILQSGGLQSKNLVVQLLLPEKSGE